MAVTRIWNITDGGQKGVTPHARMVLGQTLKPGQFVRVEAARLIGATKVKADANAQMLAIGELPAWYAAKKKPPRAVVDARIIKPDGKVEGRKVEVAKGHASGVPAKAMAADVAKKIDEVAPGTEVVEPEPPKAEETTVEETTVEEPVEEPVEESKDKEDKGVFGGKRRKRK